MLPLITLQDNDFEIFTLMSTQNHVYNVTNTDCNEETYITSLLLTDFIVVASCRFAMWEGVYHFTTTHIIPDSVQLCSTLSVAYYSLEKVRLRILVSEKIRSQGLLLKNLWNFKDSWNILFKNLVIYTAENNCLVCWHYDWGRKLEGFTSLAFIPTHLLWYDWQYWYFRTHCYMGHRGAHWTVIL